MTVVAVTRAELAAALATLAEPARPLGLVPTMGALHDGHSALIAAARAADRSVVVSIFVNPLQFGPGEDFEKYPRSFAADVARCEQAGVAVIWAPTVADMYGAGPAQVTVSPGPLGDQLEGAQRPGHFAGMLTVVTKLLTSVRPDRAYFGEKDYQQLTLITRLVADLDLGVEIVGVPTVREPDGLALSSRNVYLRADERRRALGLARALDAGAAAASGGPDAVVGAAAKVLADAGIDPDYLALRGLDLGAPPAHGPARLLVAARVGSPRLIDNIEVTL
jgi:pantoate--beta-alanine ligase